MGRARQAGQQQHHHHHHHHHQQQQQQEHPLPRRQVALGLLLLLLRPQGTLALADFAGYLTKLLQNHTAYACDGERLSLQCPRHSTISIQSAYYGQAYQLCSAQQPEALMREPLNCVTSTTLQKILDECQDLRACQLLVNSRVFGPDLCPGITKYLLVSFKCKPTEYKTKSVCENEELKLHCKESKFLNIYSASYGRSAHEKDICSTEMGRLPQFVPKFILAAVDPMVTNLHPSWKPKEDIDFDPRESRFLNKDGIIVSSSLATFAYIRDHPERAALLFVSSVCVGLVLTLCALVLHVSCSNDLENRRRIKKRLVLEDKVDENSKDEEEEEEEEEEEDERDDSSDSDFADGFCRTPYSAYYSMDPAELAERIERREQIIQEIWMNSGLDASPTRSLSPFYINEQECICFG
ncbi:protein eva-1 homolog C isoform X2 [Sceloporus undulatus]|uniref:protein eva-1 homolog C isoform X2 n=1 Tax=Sceloporus undulatus TaxID=8520 RepID=UPI001C4A9579|nr:protein eva-1 homolog C isoform X2 [Sceloporus undulatus]